MDEQTQLEIPVELQEQLKRGNVLLFLGEGINHSPGGVPGFPTHDELAAELASRCDYPADAPLTLSHVAQFCEDTGPGRQSLLAIFKDRLGKPDFAPGKNHRQIARLPVKVIVTTCYDDLMERALRAASPPRSYTLVVGRVDTAFLDEEKTALVKLWGDLSQAESLVVTEDDRRTFLRNRQSIAHFLSSELIRRTWVFLGYNVADPSFQDFFDIVRLSVQGFEKQAFVVGTKPPTHVFRWWQKRNVMVLEAEILDVLNLLVSTATQSRLVTPVNPYKLLEAFSGVDRSVFAGRDREIEELLQRVRRQSLIVLFGESGTGKTSLINAGLVPRLRDEDWFVVSVRCLDEPVSLIRREALSVVQQASGLTIEQLKGEVGALGATADLAEFMRRLGHYLTRERRWLVIIVDQFEEIFTRAGELQRQQLAQAVKAIQELPELQGRLVVLFALREDYLGQLWSWAYDNDLDAAWYNAFRITRLADEQARQAIVEPARKSDAVFETDLVDQVLHGLRDIGDGLVYPPYLQVVCFALFEHGLRQRDGAALHVGVADYERLGKAEQIVADYLDKSLFEELTPLYRRIAEGVLDALTGASGLRTLMSFEEISRAVGDDPARVREVIEVLVRRRVVRPYWDKDRLKGYELVHDFLSQRFFDRLSPERQQQKLALQLYCQAVSDWKTLKLPVDHSRLDMFLGHADILPFDEAGYRMVLKTAASDVDRFDRWAHIIARRADERSVLALVEQLENPQWQVRVAAIETLGSMGETASQAAEPLSKRLVIDRTWQVRKAAAQALGSIKETAPSVVEALTKSLEDRTRHVRRAAAEALGEIRASQAAEPLTAQLLDKNRNERQIAMNALVSIGQAAVSPLIQQLTSTKVRVRLAAVEVLGSIGPEAELAIEPLVGALEDESDEMRLATIKALGQIWDVPALIRLGDKRTEVRLAAAKELRIDIFAQAVEVIIAALKDEDVEVRQAVAQLLGQTKDARAVEPLIVALEDSNQNVRQAAAQALGQIGDKQAVEALIAALEDTISRVRQTAALVLGEIQDKRAVEPLLATLGDSNKEVRQATAYALGQLGDVRAVKPLIVVLEDSESDVGQAAAEALGEIGDVQAVGPLIAVVEDSGSDVGQAAVRALGKLWCEQSVEPLIAAMSDLRASRGLEVVLRETGSEKIKVIKAVRELTGLSLRESKEMVDNVPTVVARDLDVLMATYIQERFQVTGAVVEVRGDATFPPIVRATRKLGQEQRAVEPLIAMLRYSGRAEYRGAAAQALGQIGDDRAIEWLIIRLWDTHWTVCQAAVQALGQLWCEQSVEPLIAAMSDLRASRGLEVVLCEIGPKKVEVIKAVRRLIGLGLRESKEMVDSVPTVVARDLDVLRAKYIQERFEVTGAVVEVRGDIPFSPTRLMVQILGRLIGDQQVVELLIAALVDSDWTMRRAVAQALGEIGDERAVEALIAVLRDEDWEVCEAAAQALGQIGDKRAVEPFIAALRDDDWRVREAAAQALGQIGDERAVGPFIAVLSDDDFEVRKAAAQALGKMGELSLGPLIAALGDSDSDVRETAAQALGQIGDKRAVEALVAALGDDASRVRRAATQALGQIGDERAVEPLITALGDSDSHVRETAARVLGEIGDKWAVEALVAALGDDGFWVRRAATQALGKIGELSVGPLIAVLGDSDSDVRETAARVLGEIGEPSVEPLIAALGDSDSDVRETVAQALGEIGDKSAVGALVAALRDDTVRVRQAAAQALGQIGDERAVEPLVGMLDDLRVREAAAQALGQIGDERAVEPLVGMLEDWRVREAAAQALGQIGDERAVEPLIAVLGRADWGMRQAAVQALRAIGGSEAEAALRRRGAQRGA